MSKLEMMSKPVNDYEKYLEVTYDGSEISKWSIAETVLSMCSNPPFQQSTLECAKNLQTYLNFGCLLDSQYSKSECDKIIENGYYEACKALPQKLPECQKIGMYPIRTIITTTEWFWGLIGLIGGIVFGVIIWMLVYCVCCGILKKKKKLQPPGGTTPVTGSPAPKNSKEASKSPVVTANQEQYLW